MIWLSWRQQRLETALSALVLALAAALLVPLGLHMASVYHDTGVAACLAGKAHSGCGTAVDSFQHRFEHAGTVIPWLNFVPGFFGIVLAAPLVLEFEQGTFRLAWTQSITRRRWIAAKLTAITAIALVATLGLTVLMTWWRQPLDHLQGRMDTNVFDFEGAVPFAYTLFAIALVIAVGVFARRTVTAIAVSFVGYLALRIVIQSWLRQHFIAPVKAVIPAGHSFPANFSKSWTLHSGLSDRLGHPLANASSIMNECSTNFRLSTSCLQHHGAYNYVVYQPASRFWALQGIESGIYVALALLLAGASVWWIRHRIA
jgi:hypothetical protein